MSETLILRKLDLIISLLRAVLREGEVEMAELDDILAKVTAEKTVIDSIKVLVDALKANQNDPLKLQEIVAALDVNDVALAAIANTDSAPPV